MNDYEYVFIDKVEIKLLILYILHQAKSVAKQPYLTRQFLSDFIMQNIEVSYFDMQEAIPALAEDGFLMQYTKNHKETLEITKTGMDTLGFFYKKLPLSIRDKIDAEIYQSLVEYKDSASVVADYWPDNPRSFTAGLKIFEDDNLSLQLNVSFTNADDAQKLTRKFKEKPEWFYQKIIQICAEAIEECKSEKQSGKEK